LANWNNEYKAIFTKHKHKSITGEQYGKLSKNLHKLGWQLLNLDFKWP